MLERCERAGVYIDRRSVLRVVPVCARARVSLAGDCVWLARLPGPGRGRDTDRNSYTPRRWPAAADAVCTLFMSVSLQQKQYNQRFCKSEAKQKFFPGKHANMLKHASIPPRPATGDA